MIWSKIASDCISANKSTDFIRYLKLDPNAIDNFMDASKKSMSMIKYDGINSWRNRYYEIATRTMLEQLIDDFDKRGNLRKKLISCMNALGLAD